MKLSNQQVNALVEMLFDQEKERLSKLNAAALKKSEMANSARIKELVRFYKTIPKDLLEAIHGYGNTIEKKLTDHFASERKIESPNRNKIRNEILIASIDTNTLDELKSRLKINF